MKRYLVGALVGALLIFAWQALAHMLMHHHDTAYMKAGDEQNMLNSFSTNLKEEGQYFLPYMDPNADENTKQKFMEERVGKPWALVVYHPSMNGDMGMSAVRSFFTAFFCVLIFIWLVGKNPGSFGTVLFKSLAFGFFAFMFVWYNLNIWMQLPWSVIKGELIDDLVSWGLAGTWLGWWLNKR
jgi:hypothetical protein